MEGVAAYHSVVWLWFVRSFGYNGDIQIAIWTQLYNKIYSLFEFTNTPETWNVDYLKDHLFRDGFIGVVETQVGNVCLAGGLTGINVYGFPTEFTTANPVIGNIKEKIGE